MKITRHNYEEYFILYLDNELSSEDRSRVELFVQENPDLKEELNLLMQSQLVPDSSICFDQKEQLLRSSGTNTINTANYEDWLLLYTDNELSVDQRRVVEQFIASHPAIKTELDILQKTKLQPETIVFPHKETLYRREEKVRVVAFQWKRIAAAAALLLAVSTTAFILFNNKEQVGTEIAGVTPAKKSVQANPAIQQPINETAVIPNSQVAVNTIDKVEKQTIETKSVVANTEKRIGPKEKTTPFLRNEIKKSDAVVAEKKTNNLPQPLYNPNVNKAIEQNNPIASIDVPAKRSLTNSTETNSTSTVTPNTTQPLDHVITASSIEPVDAMDEDRPGKKNKLRGFFRKVTRTFEKTTNIKATDDEDRLLLGGLAIKL